MSFTPTTYVDGYWMSAGESDATLLGVNDDLYRLGQIIDNKGIIGFDPAYNNIQHQLMGQWAMKNTKGNFRLSDITANYKLTHGEVFYGMLGQVSASSPAHQKRTVTLLDTTVAIGEKPRYNLLTHSGTDKRQIFGCVLKDVGISWDGGKGYCEVKSKYDALSFDNSTWGSGSGELLHPGQSLSADGSNKPFSILKTLTWDDTPITSPKGVGLQMSQKLSSSPGIGANAGNKEEIDDSLGIGIGFQVGYWGNEAQLNVDHLAGTDHTLVWKMAKPNTDNPVKDIYFEVTASNCRVIQPLPFREEGKTVAYSTLIKAESISVELQDYINDYHYTYPRSV